MVSYGDKSRERLCVVSLICLHSKSQRVRFAEIQNGSQASKRNKKLSHKMAPNHVKSNNSRLHSTVWFTLIQNVGTLDYFISLINVVRLDTDCEHLDGHIFG